MVDEYIFSGSLPENASTYVTREADRELYDGLRGGKFCYVLNSRQSGKSSLRVQTMRRLRENGVECAAIDLSAGGIQNVPPEQWYADLIDSLIDIFDLDVDFADWWEENQLNSLVTRFRKFLEEILLVEVKEDIVIFIDEIDSVLSLNFPTDDFFAFIRSCYNQRVDNPAYKRLTFCLLGVASPSNLIQDKQRTPFNIGTAISLKGFQLHEIEPLEQGLRGKFSDSQAVIEEILNWTGGQPFLTQKLCQFMVEESEKENFRTVEEVVKSKIIESWESQDEPEHLRTIRARILRNEERAGYLLELYQQIRCSEEQCEITADNTIEQSELLLSGLVTRREGKLRVYNAIYKEIFNQNWIENELKNLRPYSENFKFWVDSGYKDESRLLRGKALKGAEEWAKDKNLSYQDKQFLAASREKEIQEKIAVEKREAQLERERKDKEAVEKRNLVLSEANRKAKQRIRVGSFILVIALSFTAISTFVAANKVRETRKINEYLGTVEKLTQLAGELEDESSNDEAKELFSQAGQSVNIKDHKIRLAVLNAGISYAYQKLKSKDLAKAGHYLKKSKQQSQKQCKHLEKNFATEVLQICVLTLKTAGNLFTEKNEIQEAIKEYQLAYKHLESLKSEGKRGNRIAKISPPFNNNFKIKILSRENVEALHREFINLLSQAENKNLNNLNIQVQRSLKAHYLDELNNLLENEKLWEADNRTTELMFYMTDREKERYFSIESLKNFDCSDIREIDSLWIQHSQKRFGFSVQKQIWLEENNPLGVTEWKDEYEKAYISYASRIRWYNGKSFLKRSEVISIAEKDYRNAPKGILPTKVGSEYNKKLDSKGFLARNYSLLALRLSECGI
ncbi:MAG: AAA-like domain-containing protein [Cyanobacteria bacterium J06635_10]